MQSCLMSATSPLARGLRWRSPRWGRPPRIIPARAGFTAGCGLRRRATRIIPARAGFTRTATGRGGRWWDHPRSRGVYATHLAPRCFETSDHPRSRGVYADKNRVDQAVNGSSPLARGLQASDFASARLCGIIPARAGFTHADGRSAVIIMDHPRSRGVYRRAGSSRRPRRGSSPLARGLLPVPVTCTLEPGIIPARAGFTEAVVSVAHLVEDHPRSRGVYLPAQHRPRSWGGSSPLARGLLPPLRAGRSDERIIPARAGFTPGRGRPRPGRRIIPARAGFTRRPARLVVEPQDHPRSRGVYSQSSLRMAVSAGSSPLARGLPCRARSLISSQWIIPARAGFTRCGPG